MAATASHCRQPSRMAFTPKGTSAAGTPVVVDSVVEVSIVGVVMSELLHKPSPLA